tara:strand:+ start:250 stop:1161 length:912 start_codon:yes stop_codon:yes gene_type:complete
MIFENKNLNDITKSTELQKYKNDFSKQGYLYLPNMLSDEFISSIKKDVYRSRNNFNNNKLAGVSLKSQYYNTFMLSISKDFFNYCTSEFVLDFSREMLQRDDFRLKALRYYETSSGNKMQWHTDTKTPEGFKRIPGLIYICYVSDVPKGEFQYIEGSHNWSQESLENDFNEDFINKKYSKQIKSFKGSSGDLLIYDTAGIHRANTFFDKNFTRCSLFFQVDCENNSEPIYLNPSFIDPTNKRVLKYLGFGQPSTYKEFPVSSAGLAPTSLILKKVVFPKIKRILIDFIKLLVPKKFIKRIKNK